MGGMLLSSLPTTHYPLSCPILAHSLSQSHRSANLRAFRINRLRTLLHSLAQVFLRTLLGVWLTHHSIQSDPEDPKAAPREQQILCSEFQNTCCKGFFPSNH